MTSDETNALTAELIKTVGRIVGSIPYTAKMVCIEGLAAGLIVLVATQHNKQPDELTDAFCEGVRERVTRAIYGRQQ